MLKGFQELSQGCAWQPWDPRLELADAFGVKFQLHQYLLPETSATRKAWGYYYVAISYSRFEFEDSDREETVNIPMTRTT